MGEMIRGLYQFVVSDSFYITVDEAADCEF